MHYFAVKVIVLERKRLIEKSLMQSFSLHKYQSQICRIDSYVRLLAPIGDPDKYQYSQHIHEYPRELDPYSLSIPSKSFCGTGKRPPVQVLSDHVLLCC